LSSYWIHLITPLSHHIAKPLAEGLKNPVVCRENRITKLIPQELLTVREAIRTALRKVTENQVETNWSMAGPIPSDPDWAGGTVFRDEREIVIEAPDWAVFRAVCRVGGGHGWYAADWLWRIRGWIDLVVGGPGLRRGRRDPEMVRYGEALDFWRVVGVERDKRLVLRAEMKLPGEALIEFRVEARGEFQCLLQQRALFRPRGLFGLLYWYAVAPLHHVVFRGMLLGIRREALKIAAGSEGSTKANGCRHRYINVEGRDNRFSAPHAPCEVTSFLRFFRMLSIQKRISRPCRRRDRLSCSCGYGESGISLTPYTGV